MANNSTNRNRQEHSVYNAKSSRKRDYIEQDSIAGKKNDINLRSIIYRSVILVLIIVLGGVLIYAQWAKKRNKEDVAQVPGETVPKEVSVVVRKSQAEDLGTNQTQFILHDFADFSPRDIPVDKPVKIDINSVRQAAWHLTQAERFYRWKEWEDALRDYEQVEGIMPDLLGLHDRMGLCLFWLGDYSAAMDHFKESLRISPNSVGVLNNLGLTMMFRQEYEQSDKYFMQAIKLDKKYSPAYYNLGLVRFRAGDMDAAANILRDYLALEPDNESAANLFSQALMRAGRWDEAVVVLRSSVLMMPQAVPLYFRLAEALVKTGSYDEAMSSLEKAIEMTDAKSGLTCLSQGDYDPIRQRKEFQDIVMRLGRAL